MLEVSDVVNKIKNGLIVSCQALENEPLHSPYIMGRMAVAAVESGAIGIRANSVVDIREIKSVVDVPVIGIMKQVYEGNTVFITPTLKEMREIAETGVEVIACDATLRKRPNGEDLKKIITTIKNEYPNILLMADCSTVEDVENACKIGFDFVGTTLHGYTEDTKGMDISNNDFSVMKEIIEVSTLPVIAEGKIDTPDKAKRVLELGCHSVVVGGAITRPQEITKKFIEKIES